MRIIAGTAKGRTLKTLKGLDTRPTLERVREAVFNTLGTKVCGARLLDLFAGSGAIGIEALSRGAAYCCFNDQNKTAGQIIKENVQKCRFEQQCRIYVADGLRLISRLNKNDSDQFDLVYLDPPYLFGEYALYLHKIGEAGIMSPDSIVIVESGKNIFLEEYYQGLKLLKKRNYGDTVIWYYYLLGEE